MAKEKVTLTLDSDLLGELRQRVGARSLSATVDDALATRVAHLRHLAAVDRWLAEMEAEDGPIPEEMMAWAKEVFDRARARSRHHPDRPSQEQEADDAAAGQ